MSEPLSYYRVPQIWLVPGFPEQLPTSENVTFPRLLLKRSIALKGEEMAFC